MEIKGKVIKEITENRRKGVSAKSGKSWCMTEFLVEHDLESKYQRKAVIGFFQSGDEGTIVKDAIEQLKEGVIATFHLDIDANEYNGKFYNQIRAWKFDIECAAFAKPSNAAPESVSPSSSGGSETSAASNGTANQQGVGSCNTDDLPF